MSVMPHSQGSPLSLTQHLGYCPEPISDSNITTSSNNAPDDTWPDDSADLDVSSVNLFNTLTFLSDAQATFEVNLLATTLLSSLDNAIEC